MHPEIDQRLQTAGFVTRPEILEAGHGDRSITAAVRRGDLVRIGPGLFAPGGFRQLTPERQHALRCHAVATRFPDSVAFSHQSAAILHGAATWGVDLTELHTTRLDDGRGRRQAGVRHHVAELPMSDVIELDGLSVTSPARTAWDLAVQCGLEAGTACVDSLLNGGLTTVDEVREQWQRNRSWAGARHAWRTLTRCDAGSESVGESRAAHLFAEFGLPRPRRQFKIFDESGALIAISDFAWPEFRHVGEFDGLSKYGSGLDLAREKAREDAIRRLGWGMTRMIWSQLSGRQRAMLARELKRAMAESRSLYGHLAG